MANSAKSGKVQQKQISIDYPKSGEEIFPEHYAVRISARPCEKVEVSVDGGLWQGCFNNSGYWWIHLTDLQDGAHSITARGTFGGQVRFSIRKFTVNGKPE